MIEASIKDILPPLGKVLYIHFLFFFQKNLHKTRALIDLNSKINITPLAHSAKLDLKIRKTNIEAQKIDGSSLNIFEIVLADFQIEDKIGKARFF